MGEVALGCNYRDATSDRLVKIFFDYPLSSPYSFYVF